MAQKYVITAKSDHRIFAMGNQMDYLDNGYPRLIEENLAFPTQFANAYGPVEVPDGVKPEEYCYDGEQFFPNPNYEPESD